MLINSLDEIQKDIALKYWKEGKNMDIIANEHHLSKPRISAIKKQIIKKLNNPTTLQKIFNKNTINSSLEQPITELKLKKQTTNLLQTLGCYSKEDLYKLMLDKNSDQYKMLSYRTKKIILNTLLEK